MRVGGTVCACTNTERPKKKQLLEHAVVYRRQYCVPPCRHLLPSVRIGNLDTRS
jgi:hypothetical protein